jgi:mRNA-degrading endonuclease RelE of RelBE toxin-antitoxin system
LDEAKVLLKKYPNIKKDFLELAKELKNDPITGNTRLIDDCYKVRMQISDKSGGKSGGARVIVNVQVINKEVYVISVFDKSRLETIKDFVLKKLLRKILPSYYSH